MNKDVIYIEPEDDITDIIAKIENSKSKVVALVPPKKASVFRSIVNLKLVAKSGASAEKSVVIVTTDPSIVKLAAATHLPVTKDLKSAPKVPEAEAEETASEEVIEAPAEPEAEGAEATTEEIAAEEAGQLEGKSGFLDEELAEEETEAAADETEAGQTSDGPASEVTAEETEAAEETKDETATKAVSKDKQAKKPDLKSNNPVLRWIQEHKKVVIPVGIGAVVLIVFLIWAFAIAPAAEVTVGIRTTTTNFSENVSFTEKMSEENASAGKFYLEEKKLEEKSEVEFVATGKKNVGEKASGTLTVYAQIPALEGGSRSLRAGSEFTYEGLSFIVNEDITFSYVAGDPSVCDNATDGAGVFMSKGCVMSGTVAVTAAGAGAAYNVSTNGTGWSSVNGIAVSSASIGGGTDKTITVVQQSDIDKAKEQIETSNEDFNKQRLLAMVAEDAFVIEASFKQTVGEAVSSPAVGEEVAEGAKAKLSVTTTDTIYIIDGTKVEEFIREKAKLADNYKIYEMNDPFVENFVKVDEGYVAKLKTSYVSGPKITESEVAEVVKGKGVGTARQDLEKAYDGISRINIQTNHPWVSRIPGDSNKITVNIEVDEK